MMGNVTEVKDVSSVKTLGTHHFFGVANVQNGRMLFCWNPAAVSKMEMRSHLQKWDYLCGCV